MPTSLHRKLIDILSTYYADDAKARLDEFRNLKRMELDERKRSLEAQCTYASLLLTMLQMPEDSIQHQEAERVLEQLSGGEFEWQM